MSLKSDVWFNGPVKDAIALVSQKNCVFLVYIYDDSEKTNKLNTVFEDEKVAEAIKNNAIAFAMKNGSEDANMFSQYYPVQAVPILYFIKQGTIRDFGIETISGQEIVDKIDATNNIQPNIVPTTSASATQPHSMESTAEAVPGTTTTTSSSSSASEDQSQAKKKELQKQLEKVRKERMEREQKEAKEREIKRRNESKVLQEAQQNRMDKENKIYFDKIKKERQEDEAHRKKVREQIARDRAEKIAQRSAEKQRSHTEEAASNTQVSSSQHHDVSNLSIRQLDGSSIRHQFKATDTLGLVREWIQQNRTDDASAPYKLSSQFPTRHFTETDDKTMLRDLDLCPSATMIMKPIRAARSTTSSLSTSTGIGGYLASAYNFVWGLLIMLFNMFSSILTSMFPAHGMRPLNAPPQTGTPAPFSHSLRGGGQRLGGGETSRPDSSSFDANPSSSQVQKRSNPYKTRINTLQDENADEDEDKKRPTYNGNSVNHE